MDRVGNIHVINFKEASGRFFFHFLEVFMPRHKKWRGIMLYPPNFLVSVRPSAIDLSCPLYNFDTVQDNFTKLGTNVKHDQTTCRD